MKLGPPFFPAKNGLGHMFKPKFSVKKLWQPLPTFFKVHKGKDCIYPP